MATDLKIVKQHCAQLNTIFTLLISHFDDSITHQLLDSGADTLAWLEQNLPDSVPSLYFDLPLIQAMRKLRDTPPK